MDDGTYKLKKITTKKVIDYTKELKNREFNEIYSDEYINWLLNYFYGLDSKVIDDMDIVNIGILVSVIDLYMNVVVEKINSIGDEGKKIIKKKSAFDEYDKENGYLDEEEESVDLIDNINLITKYCVSSRSYSVKEVYDSEILDVIQYVDFDIEYEKEHKNN